MLVRRLADRISEHQRIMLRSILEPMAVDVGAILSAHEELETSPTGALDELERELQRNDRWIFVGYDELDTLGGFDWEMMIRMARGLVAFWSDYSRRWERIRAKIFLRSDLFRRHAGMGTADFAKLAANRAELAWSDAALLGMLVKRIANTSDELAAYCRGARLKFERTRPTGIGAEDQGSSRRVASPERLARIAHQGNIHGVELCGICKWSKQIQSHKETTPWKHTVLQNNCHLKVSVGAQWWARLTAVD